MVIQPFLAALDSGPIVEIGAAAGNTTMRLAELAAARELTLHSIDPSPDFDTATYEERFGNHFRFHRDLSHNVLERIGPAAAVLIDGDHNWYTVHGELTRLERIASSSGLPFPLVLLHDVEWPYARRDMYYGPDRIPDKWRQPWARRGIAWGQSRLADGGGGLNSKLANALEEGGPCNGVLTAVEDFMAESPLPLELRIVRGNFGIGVLATEELLASSSEIRSRWEELRSTPFLLAEAERLSAAAAQQGARHAEALRDIERLDAELRTVRGERGER